MAEFAKESMWHQALDNEEIITVKWSLKDPDPNEEAKEKEKEDEIEKVDKNPASKKIKKNKKGKKKPKEKPKEEKKETPKPPSINTLFQQDIKNIEARKKQIMKSCQKMNAILERIENKGENQDTEPNLEIPAFSKEDYNLPPGMNNEPLQFNKK